MPRQPRKTLEELAAESGRYPVDAFVFIQECIGVAAEKVHGPLNEDQVEVIQWMGKHDVTLEELTRRWEEGVLPGHIREALDRMGGPARLNRHVTGQQLCWAIRDVALERWGYMARGVLARWNIRSTEDIGAIVFALVESDWLAKQPTDSIADFKRVFNFAEAFDRGYRIALS